MLALLVLLLFAGVVIAAGRLARSDRWLREGRASERELLDAIEHEKRQ